MELPVFKCVIDDDPDSDLQVEFVALVDRPAIERNFLSFKKHLGFSLDTDKRIVTGPAMLADMLIYRNDPAIGEYYTTFDAPSILSIVQKFFKKGYIQNFNLMHDPGQKTSDITIYESFITNKEQGKLPPKGFEDAADGSWFISAKVEDDAVWEKVKSGEVKGFSVEGIFKQVPVTKLDKEKSVKNISSNMKNDKRKSLIDKIKGLFDNDVKETSSKKLKDGTEVTIDKLEVGGVVQKAGAPVTEGAYTLEDGTALTVDKMGVITAIQPPAADMVELEKKIDEGITKFIAEAKLDKEKIANQSKQIETLQTELTETKGLIKEVFNLVEILVAEPSGGGGIPAKKTFSFQQEKDDKKKSINRFHIAAAKLRETTEKK